MINKTDIKNLSFAELQEIVLELKEKKFRAKQLFDWIYNKKIESIDRITNIPPKILDKVFDCFPFTSVMPEKIEESKDGTLKFVLPLKDGELIESVIIPKGKRNTLCVSTQVGCRFGCKICLTAKMGYIRNLKSGEILEQILCATNILNKDELRLTNIVFMGMGEPLDNLEEVIKAIAIVCNENGFGMSPKRLTISTVGIPNKIKELSLRFPKIGIAFSMHASTDEKRKTIIPLANKFTIEQVAKELRNAEQRGNKITYEYVMIQGFNCTEEDAKNLIQLLSFYPGKLNLIPINPGGKKEFVPPSENDINSFMELFENTDITVTVRRSAGNDINGACGQLYTKIKQG